MHPITPSVQSLYVGILLTFEYIAEKLGRSTDEPFDQFNRICDHLAGRIRNTCECEPATIKQMEDDILVELRDVPGPCGDGRSEDITIRISVSGKAAPSHRSENP